MNTLTRDVLREWLEDSISDISGWVYAAGWHSGIEFDVWEECHGTKVLPEKIVRRLLVDILAVANDLGEWVHQRKPISMSDWRKLVAARNGIEK